MSTGKYEEQNKCNAVFSATHVFFQLPPGSISKQKKSSSGNYPYFVQLPTPRPCRLPQSDVFNHITFNLTITKTVSNVPYNDKKIKTRHVKDVSDG